MQGTKYGPLLWHSRLTWLFFGLAFALLALQAHAAQSVSPIQSASELDYPPFSVIRKDGQADGFSVEMLRAALHAVGRDVQFKVGPFHEIKQDLAEGRLQVLPAVARSDARKLIYDFTAPYISMHGTLVVRKGDSRIRNLEDLRGKTLVLLKGDLAEDYAKGHKLTDQIKTTDSYEEAFRQLAAGQHDALLVQKLVGEKLIQQLGLSNLETVGPPIPHFQDFCFAVRLGDKELLSTLNEGLALIIANGTVERLREKWISPTRDEAYANLRHNLFIVLGVLLLGGLPAYLVHRARLAEVNRRSAQLRESDARFERAVNGVNDGIWEWIAGTGKEYLSPRWKKLLGYEEHELLNVSESFFNQIHPDDQAQAKEAMQAHLERREAYVIELRLRLKDGSYRWFLVRGQAVWDDKGQPVSMAGSITDITERKRVEREFIAARDQAIAANRVKDEFISTVSHELRTPLTSINGALGLILGGICGEIPVRARSMMDIAHRNVQRLTFLINDLLDMEKLAAGKMHFDCQPQLLRALVTQTLESTQTFCVEHRISVTLADTGGDALVLVDSQRLMQVLSNLLSNAIKYSFDGGTVEVAIQKRDNHMRVEVRDYGKGISAEFRPRIFGEFSQADSSDTRSKGGTGLGLAISKKLIMHMNGEIGFDSVEGQGAMFFIELPICDSEKGSD